MRKLLFLILQANLCLGMFAPMEYAKTQSIQPQFTIAYLSLKSSYLTVQQNAFKHVQEIALHSCTRGMHYFEVHMRKLCVNGSAYLRTIRDAIQSTIDKLGSRNTQRSVMDKHKEIIDTVLSSSDMQRIDAYLEIQELIKQGNVAEAFDCVSAYQSLYGECDSAHEIRQLISDHAYARSVQSSSDTRYLFVADKDAKIGEAASSLSIQAQPYAQIHHDGSGISSRSGMPGHRSIGTRGRDIVTDIRSNRIVTPNKTVTEKSTAPTQVVEYREKQPQIELRVEKTTELEKQKQVAKELQIDALSKITNALQASKTKQVLARNINIAKDTVYAKAQKYNYEIASELKDQIQASINGLALCNDPHEFIFHVATVNHSLTDIQIGTAHKAGIAPSLSQQASELCAHGIEKYCEYLVAPTQNEVALLTSLAQYISDTTTGTHYLTPEMREARIAQCWNSLKNICDTTPANLVDNCMYAAARVTWAMGIIKAGQVIKEAAFVAGHQAYQFMQNFNQVISNNPVMITAEGAIAVAAKQELGWGQTIARAIWGAPKNEINSVDGLMSFLESEKNPTNSNSLLKNKKTVQDLIKESKPGKETSGKTKQYEKVGGTQKAIEDFESLRPKSDSSRSLPKGIKKIGQLDDGRTVLVREVGGQGNEYRTCTTLEIQQGNKRIKIRYF